LRRLSRRTRLLCCGCCCCCGFLRLAAEGSNRFNFGLLLRRCSRGGSSLLALLFLGGRCSRNILVVCMITEDSFLVLLS
jgi:hypothetical protein